MRSASCLLIFSWLFRLASGRTWTEIVDPLLYVYAGFDANRVLYIQESDPFDFGTKVPTVQLTLGNPSAAPTSAPLAPQASLRPTVAPTPAPTKRSGYRDGNGGCLSHETLYEITLFDLWGDGWGNSELQLTRMAFPGETADSKLSQESQNGESIDISEVIDLSRSPLKEQPTSMRVFVGTLIDGSQRRDYVCLEANLCYQADTSSSEFDYEIKWEVRKVLVGLDQEQWDEPFVRGLAPDTCHFSIPGSNGLVCPNTCGQRSPRLKNSPFIGGTETKAPSILPWPTSPPTVQPTSKPIFHPTALKVTTAPSLLATVQPSDVPSFVPTEPIQSTSMFGG